MPFPPADRVLFSKNPLDRVICQLRFPPILLIDSKTPAEFQERIRRHSPNFSETAEWKFEVSSDPKRQIPAELLRQAMQSTSTKNYEFSSEDGDWKINLTRAFVALTTKKYERWEEFKQKLEIPLTAFIDVYSPDDFTRIGLRYVDVIRRSSIDLADESWDRLLQPYILGQLSSPDVADNVINFENKYELELSDKKSTVRIITKFVKAEDNGEICFMLDSDFFSREKVRLNEAINKLDYFNVRASRLIQWCITDLLRKAMDPKKI